MQKATYSPSKAEFEVMESLESGLTLEETKEKTKIKDVISVVNTMFQRWGRDNVFQKFPFVYNSYQDLPRGKNNEITSDPMEAADEAGLPKKMIQAIQRRVMARRGEIEETPRLTDRQLIEEIEIKIAKTISYLDDFSLSSASAKDLASVVDLLINKAQLLKGKPTSITSVEDRRKIQELIPMVLNEARRRGMIEDAVEAEVVK